jgi:hypothetical protein
MLMKIARRTELTCTTLAQARRRNIRVLDRGGHPNAERSKRTAVLPYQFLAPTIVCVLSICTSIVSGSRGLMRLGEKGSSQMPIFAGLNTSGGEGGIRTLGTGVSPYNGLANRRIRPLCHLSGVWSYSLPRRHRSLRASVTRVGRLLRNLRSRCLQCFQAEEF